MNLTLVKEGLRIFLSSRKIKKKGIKKYSGDAREICQQIVSDCWTGNFFKASQGNFAQFWTRDFNWCCRSLIKLGHQKKVKQTLLYALNHFQNHGQVTTTITPQGKPFDVYTYAVDSWPSLINCLRLLNDLELNNRFRPFLEKETMKFYEKVIEKETGLVKRKDFSSMKDYSKRKSSCYDNCMVAFLSWNLEQLGWFNPLKKHDYPKLIKAQFWNGRYFYDDLDKRNYVAGDANIFPFILGVFNDKEMIKSAVKQIQSAKLDQPFPLKYTNHHPGHFIFWEFLVPNYEKNTLWQHMAPLYIKLVQATNLDLFEKYYSDLTKLIEKYQNYLELFNPDGTIFKSHFYHSAQGMLWAANYLTLK